MRNTADDLLTSVAFLCDSMRIIGSKNKSEHFRSRDSADEESKRPLIVLHIPKLDSPFSVACLLYTTAHSLVEACHRT